MGQCRRLLFILREFRSRFARSGANSKAVTRNVRGRWLC